MRIECYNYFNKLIVLYYIKIIMQEQLDKVKLELEIRNYSQKTIKSYLLCLKYYFNYIGNDYLVIKGKVKFLPPNLINISLVL